MTLIHFVGIDISKNHFDMACADAPAKVERFANDAAGIDRFLQTFAAHLPDALVVMESTGGYETALLTRLVAAGIRVHRADPLTAKHFIRSLGKRAKTDRLDAAALARYAQERHSHLPLFVLKSEAQQRLAALMTRRADLLAMRVAETNRLKHPGYRSLAASVEAVLAMLAHQIEEIETAMADLIAADAALTRKVAVMTAFKGVGFQTAATLAAALPELGTLSAKQAASLAGCAPHARDSGTRQGYRRTWGGRQNVKRCLFLAAMAARRHNPQLRTFYERLVANGKKPIVAITALMRKIVVILNAKIRDDQIQTTW